MQMVHLTCTLVGMVRHNAVDIMTMHHKSYNTLQEHLWCWIFRVLSGYGYVHVIQTTFIGLCDANNIRWTTWFRQKWCFWRWDCAFGWCLTFQYSSLRQFSLLGLDVRQSNWHFASPFLLPWLCRWRRSSRFLLVLNIRLKWKKLNELKIGFSGIRWNSSFLAQQFFFDATQVVESSTTKLSSLVFSNRDRRELHLGPRWTKLVPISLLSCRICWWSLKLLSCTRRLRIAILFATGIIPPLADKQMCFKSSTV